MKLKELFMQVTYGDIESAIEEAFGICGCEVNPNKKASWEKMLEEIQALEPIEDPDMKIMVYPGNVSGYYDDKTKKAKGIDYPGVYSLVATRWEEWLGMDVMDETLERMSVAEILGNCIFEMSYFGYDMKSWTRNVEERFGPDTE